MDAWELKRRVTEIVKRLRDDEIVTHDECELLYFYIEMLEYKQDRYEKALDFVSVHVRELQQEMREVGLAH